MFVSAAGGRVIGVVLGGGGDNGATGLRAIKKNGGTALVPRPDQAALPAWHPNASSPVPKIVSSLGSFRYRTLPHGSRNRLAAQGRA